MFIPRFDPINGKVPDEPFDFQLVNIANRARALLNKRTKREVLVAGETLELLIDDCRKVYPINNGKGLPRNSLVIEGPNSEIDIIKQCFKNFEFGDSDLSEVKVYEYYAIYSLRVLNKVLSALRCGLPSNLETVEGGELTPEILELINIKESHPPNLSLAGKYAIQAMEALCYAEYLAGIGHFKESEKEKQSLQAKNRNVIRHAKNHEVKDRITKEWARTRLEFNDMSHAAEYFHDRLLDDSEKYTRGTVYGWIRKYAKENGIENVGKTANLKMS